MRLEIEQLIDQVISKSKGRFARLIHQMTGVEFNQKGALFTGPCPFCTNDAMTVDDIEGTFTCTGCGISSGSVLVFMQLATNLGVTSSALFLAGRWSIRPTFASEDIRVGRWS